MIPVPDPGFLPIPDPGVKKASEPGPRIRNISITQCYRRKDPDSVRKNPGLTC